MSLQTDLEETVQLLVTALKAAAANPKPNYSIQGQSVSHADYMKMLTASIKEVSELSGSLVPFEIRSQMI